MTSARWVKLGARIASATLWAALVVVLGLWLELERPAIMQEARVPISGGLAAISGGTFLFMTMVADRLIPTAQRRLLLWVLEMATGVVFLVTLVSAVVSMVSSYRGALA